MIPELHRPVPTDRIGPAGLDIMVQASTDECTALAARMNLPGVNSLTCSFHLERDLADSLLAHGHLRAEVVQTCVISLEDFAATVEDHFVIRCVPEGQESEDDDPEALDEFVYRDGMIDLGEAAAEQLALALDPYPHAPGAVLPEFPEEPDAGPLAGLAALKRH